MMQTTLAPPVGATGDGQEARTSPQGAPQRAEDRREPLVVVTGSSGLIGSRLCEALRGSHRVVGLDRDEPPGGRHGPGAPSLFLACDLTEDASVSHALDEVARTHGEEIASVVHLAAYYDFSGEPSPLYDTLTVEGTRRLLRGLQAFQVEQLVFSSSLLVMRPVEKGEVLDESCPVEAEWDYPRSKLAAEQVIQEERGRIPAVVLRLAGVYDEDCRSIPIAQQIKRLFELELESHFFPGDADHGQSFLHLDDLTSCFVAALERRRELGEHEVFLIGEPEVASYRQLQDAIGEALFEKEWTTIRIPAPVAKVGAWIKEKLPGEDPFIKPWMIDLADAHLPISIERAERRLGWSPRHRLLDTIPEMVRRLLLDPVAWYRTNHMEPPDDLAQLQERRLARIAARARKGAEG